MTSKEQGRNIVGIIHIYFQTGKWFHGGYKQAAKSLTQFSLGQFVREKSHAHLLAV